MYNLLVSHEFKDRNLRAFRFDKSRFLEYTSASIQEQLSSLSIEAIHCIKSWPCVLMEEGRADELVRIARISELRDFGKELRLTVKLCPSKAHILNNHLWQIREELDIEPFEFSRNHWSVKERDLMSALREAGHEFETSAIGDFEAMSLPAPNRAAIISVRDPLSRWSHTRIDDFLLEAGVEGLSAGRAVGSRRDRANAIVQFAIESPSAVTAENSLFSAYLVSRASATEGAAEEETPPTESREIAPAIRAGPEINSAERAPNRVFVVHGRDDIARTAVVSFLESIGLVGIVLHEQPNMGRHLLTKFIQEADLVTFAVVLMTDDDVGSLNPDPRVRI